MIFNMDMKRQIKLYMYSGMIWNVAHLSPQTMSKPGDQIMFSKYFPYEKEDKL